MKWQYTKDPIQPQYEDFKGDGFTGRIISEGQHPECEWFDTPVELFAPQVVIVPVEEHEEPENEIDILKEKALSLGIKVDKRWGVRKIQEAIDDYGS